MAVQRMDLLRKLVLLFSVIFFLFFLFAIILRFFFAGQGTETIVVPKNMAPVRSFISPVKVSKGWFNHLAVVKDSHVIYANGLGLLAGSERSLYKSNDEGKTWVPMMTPLATSISAVNEQLVYVGSLEQGMGKTQDGGNTWFPTGLGRSEVIQVQAVDADTVYAIITDQYVINGGSLYKTNDGGMHWNEIYSSNWSAPVTLYAASKKTVYVGLKRGLISNGQILKTTDGGASWSIVYVGQANTHFKQIYAVDENIVFVATSTGIVKTLDGGKSWYSCTNNLPTSFENKGYGFTGIYAIDAQTAYVSYSFPYSVYVTHDGGGYWQNINMGASVNVLSGFGNTIYVGTQLALFVLKDQ